MNKKQIEIWLFFFLSPKSKISCVKKSSLVLASISKKCKLKFDKNISKCRIFQLEFPVKHWITHTMLYPGQTGASEATHIRGAWVQLKVSYAQSIPGRRFLGSQIYIYTQKHKYFLSISRRKTALPVTYSMSKLRPKLLYTSPQQ